MKINGGWRKKIETVIWRYTLYDIMYHSFLNNNTAEVRRVETTPSPAPDCVQCTPHAEKVGYCYRNIRYTTSNHTETLCRTSSKLAVTGRTSIAISEEVLSACVPILVRLSDCCMDWSVSHDSPVVRADSVSRTTWCLSNSMSLAERGMYRRLTKYTMLLPSYLCLQQSSQPLACTIHNTDLVSTYNSDLELLSCKHK